MADNHKIKDIQLFDDPDLVVLRNPVAKARFHLSVYQTKFLLEVLSHLKSRPEARILSFDIRQFNRTLNIDNNDIKYYVNEIRKMVRHVVSIPVDDKKDGGIKLTEVALIAGIHTDIDGKGEGKIKIEVADMIKPYFLEIANGQFFSFNKYNSRVLKGRYSINLYLLLKSYQRFRTLQMNYEELRDILEIKQEEYRPFKEFKRWILEKSRKEMLDKNDIYFDYDVVRETASKKSDVSKIVFYIRDNPNHAKIYKEFQLKEGKIKGAKIVVFDSLPIKTGEKSELGSSDFFEQLNSTLKSSEPIDTINPTIINIFKQLAPNETENTLITLINSLKSDGFVEERILDVLLYAQEKQQKGENIRNIIGYVKRGLESGIMGLGLAKSKRTQEQSKTANAHWDSLYKSADFQTWLQSYYLQKGMYADNNVKIEFTEASKKIPSMAGYFDESGKIKESEKDRFRISLGNKLAQTEGVTPDSLFIQWVFETQSIKLKKSKSKWYQL